MDAPDSPDGSEDSCCSDYLEEALKFSEPTPRRRAARQRLADALDKLDKPGAQAAIEAHETFPLPGLYIDDLPIGLPVSDRDAETLIRQSSFERATRGTEAHTFTFEEDEFGVRPVFTKFLESAVARHAATMGFPEDYEVVPSGVAVYEPGPAQRTRDNLTDKSKPPGYFGNVAVTLPGSFVGGWTTLGSIHNKKKGKRRPEVVTDSPDHNPEHDITIAVWYWDVALNLSEMVSGYKVVLEYDLVTRDLHKIPSGTGKQLSAIDVEEAVKSCTSDPDFQQEIYLLDQQVQASDYHAEPGLHGRNALVYEELKSCALKNGCFVLHGYVEDDSEMFFRGGHKYLDYSDRPVTLVVRGAPTGELIFGQTSGMIIKASDTLPCASLIQGVVSRPGALHGQPQLKHRIVMLTRQEVALRIMEAERSNEPIGHDDPALILDLLLAACKIRKDDGSGFQDAVKAFVADLFFYNGGDGSLRRATQWSFQIRAPDLFRRLCSSLYPFWNDEFEEDIAPWLYPGIIRTLNTTTLSVDGAEVVWADWLIEFTGPDDTPREMYHRLQRIKGGLRIELQQSFDSWTLAQMVTYMDERIVRMSPSDVPLLVRVALFKQNDEKWLTTKFAGYLKFSCTRKGMIAFVAALANYGSADKTDRLANADSLKRLFCLLFPLLRSMGPFFCVVTDDVKKLSSPYKRFMQGNSPSHRAPVFVQVVDIIRAATRNGLIKPAVCVIDACIYYFRSTRVYWVGESEVLDFLDRLLNPDLMLDTYPEIKDSLKWLLIAVLDCISEQRHLARARAAVRELRGDNNFEETLNPLDPARIKHFLGEQDFIAYFRSPNVPLAMAHLADTVEGPLVKSYEETINPKFGRNWTRVGGESDQRRIIRVTPLEAREAELEQEVAQVAKSDMVKELSLRKSSKRRAEEDPDADPSPLPRRLKLEPELN